MRRLPNISIKAQRGSVLIIALLLLTVLTILGIASLNNMTLEERMASGYQKMQQAVDGGLSAINVTIQNSAKFRLTSNDPLVMRTLGSCGELMAETRPDVNVDESAFNGGTTVAKIKVVYRGGGNGLSLMRGSDSSNAYMAFDIHADTNVAVGGITASQSSQVQTVTWVLPGGGMMVVNDSCGYDSSYIPKLKL